MPSEMKIVFLTKCSMVTYIIYMSWKNNDIHRNTCIAFYYTRFDVSFLTRILKTGSLCSGVLQNSNIKVSSIKQNIPNLYRIFLSLWRKFNLYTGYLNYKHHCNCCCVLSFEHCTCVTFFNDQAPIWTFASHSIRYNVTICGLQWTK